MSEDAKKPKTKPTKKTAPQVEAADKQPAKKPTGRKLTKKELWAQQWAPENRAAAVSNVTRGLLDQLSKDRQGAELITLDKMDQFIICCPLPSLACEYVFGARGIPFEKTITLLGPRGVSKSGSAAEIIRWPIQFLGGNGTWIEHENKISPDWVPSIIGWEYASRVGLVDATNVGDWQKATIRAANLMKKIWAGTKQEPGPGMIFPFSMVVDSIMGKSLKETQERIIRDGEGGRGHPIEALSINRYLSTIGEVLKGHPFLLVFVNHLKEHTGEDGEVTRKTPGGQSVGFMESYEIEVRRVSGKPTYANGVETNRIRWIMDKNSFGVDKRQITINVCWWDEPMTDPETGEQVMRQRSRFDWLQADIELLTNDKWYPQAKEARKLLGMTDCKVGIHKAYYAPAIGIPKTKALLPAEFAEKLLQKPNAMKRLRQIFGIKERRMFDPNIPYDKLRLTTKRELHAMMQKMNSKAKAENDDAV